MKQLFDYADKYIKQSTWKDFALLKFCLFAMGILVGIQIPEKNKKHTGIIAAVIFYSYLYFSDGKIYFGDQKAGYDRSRRRFLTGIFLTAQAKVCIKPGSA